MLVGTPVPAVIATDFKALRRMTEKRTDVPVLTIESTGVNYYDKGASKAYEMLFDTFAVEKLPVKKDTVGVIGATPLVRDTANKIYKTKVGAVLEPVLLIVLLLVCSAYLVDGSFSPFLYFRI